MTNLRHLTWMLIAAFGLVFSSAQSHAQKRPDADEPGLVADDGYELEPEPALVEAAMGTHTLALLAALEAACAGVDRLGAATRKRLGGPDAAAAPLLAAASDPRLKKEQALPQIGGRLNPDFTLDVLLDGYGVYETPARHRMRQDQPRRYRKPQQ